MRLLNIKHCLHTLAQGFMCFSYDAQCFGFVIWHACQQIQFTALVSSLRVDLLVTFGSCRSLMLAAVHCSGSSKLTREQRMWPTFPQTACMCCQLLTTRRYFGQEWLLLQCMCTAVLLAVLQCMCTPFLFAVFCLQCTPVLIGMHILKLCRALLQAPSVHPI